MAWKPDEEGDLGHSAYQGNSSHTKVETMITIEVDVPYTIYAVPVDRGRPVNLSGNSAAKNSRRSQWALILHTAARRQCELDFYFATKEYLQRTEKGQSSTIDEEVVVEVSPTVYRPSARHRDADNFWAGMKSALDGVSKAMGVDDSRFALMPINWEKGDDRTVLTIECISELDRLNEGLEDIQALLAIPINIDKTKE